MYEYLQQLLQKQLLKMCVKNKQQQHFKSYITVDNHKKISTYLRCTTRLILTFLDTTYINHPSSLYINKVQFIQSNRLWFKTRGKCFLFKSDTSDETESIILSTTHLQNYRKTFIVEHYWWLQRTVNIVI